jgi:hypothetical protein
MRKILFSSVHPSPGVGRLEKSPSPHLLSPQKISVQKIKVSENWTERGREGFRSSESGRKGKKISILILKGQSRKIGST